MYPAVLDDIMNDVLEAFNLIQDFFMQANQAVKIDEAVKNWIDGQISKLKGTIKNKYNANIDIKLSTSFNDIDGKYSIQVNQIFVYLSGDPTVYMKKEDGRVWECLRICNPQELPL